MQFDFGQNWAEFSRQALTADRVAEARTDFASLFDGVELAEKTFLDIGFGQGLSLLCAAASGARVVGCEVNPLCADVLRRNADFFPEVSVDGIRVVVGSILDSETRSRVRSGVDEGFEVVHAWGVLHHTGDMTRAIDVAAELVAPGGHLMIAIYNRHWSSPAWLQIKRIYNVLPPFLRRLMVMTIYPVIWSAKRAVAGRNPTKQQRGMDFYYDVVDWVGGYPYEYASVEAVRTLVGNAGLEYLWHRRPRVPTGCNEFLFQKPEVR